MWTQTRFFFFKVFSHPAASVPICFKAMLLCPKSCILVGYSLKISQILQRAVEMWHQVSVHQVSKGWIAEGQQEMKEKKKQWWDCTEELPPASLLMFFSLSLLLSSMQKPGMDVADAYVTFVRHSQDVLRDKVNEEMYIERLFDVSKCPLLFGHQAGETQNVTK